MSLACSPACFLQLDELAICTWILIVVESIETRHDDQIRYLPRLKLLSPELRNQRERGSQNGRPSAVRHHQAVWLSGCPPIFDPTSKVPISWVRGLLLRSGQLIRQQRHPKPVASPNSNHTRPRLLTSRFFFLPGPGVSSFASYGGPSVEIFVAQPLVNGHDRPSTSS